MAINSASDISDLILDLDPHAEAYQDAAGTTVAAAGDPVGLVPDQETGTGPYDASQSTTSQKPTLQEDASGWKYLDGDGSDDQLDTSLTDNRDQDRTIVVVFQVDAITGNHALFAATDGNNEGWSFLVDSSDFRTGNTDCIVSKTIVTAATQPEEVATPSGSVSTSVRYVAHTDSTRGVDRDFRLWLDNVEATERADGDSANVSPSFSLFRSGGFLGTDPLDGRIYRVLVYDKRLTSTERTDLYTYLDGLYASPPSGSSVTVSVQFDGTAQSGVTVVAIDPSVPGVLEAATTNSSGEATITNQGVRVPLLVQGGQGYSAAPTEAP